MPSPIGCYSAFIDTACLLFVIHGMTSCVVRCVVHVPSKVDEVLRTVAYGPCQSVRVGENCDIGFLSWQDSSVNTVVIEVRQGSTGVRCMIA